MRKIKLIIPMIVLLCFMTQFSESIAQRINLIPRVGVNYSYFNDNFDEDRIDEYDEIESKTGYQVGLDVRFGERFYVAPGIHFVQLQNNLLETDLKIKTSGLRVPVMFGADVFKSDRWGVRAYAGPSLFVMLNNDENLLDVVDDWIRKDAIFSADAGLGFDLGVITIDIQHAWGLNNYVNWDGVDLKNRVFFVSAGILF